MTDLILRGITPTLVARVQRLADKRGWPMEDALVFLLDRGLSRTIASDELETLDTHVLEDALIALKNIPNDPGFALIGRAPPPPDPDPSGFFEVPAS